jgi:hypothetical protein
LLGAGDEDIEECGADPLSLVIWVHVDAVLGDAGVGAAV